MARITVKYLYGEDVFCHGVKGIVTAVFIRGKGRCYEFSYLDSDGNPKSCHAEECELASLKTNKMGF